MNADRPAPRLRRALPGGRIRGTPVPGTSRKLARLLPLLGVLGCQSAQRGMEPGELCATLHTESLDICTELGSSCETVYCVEAINDGSLCGRSEAEDAIVDGEVLERTARECEAREQARWAEWECARGDRLVACETVTE